MKDPRHWSSSSGICVLGATLIYLMSPRFLICVSCALSIWEDRTWHFAMSVFLTESYGHSVLLPAGFGLVVAGSLLIFGVLIVFFRCKDFASTVAHASLFTLNASVAAGCVVLMPVFSYRGETTQTRHGWFWFLCSFSSSSGCQISNSASTVLTIAIQRGWIVSLTADNRGQLAGTNEAVRRLDQIINIFAPLSVGQVLTWASPVICGGFIFGWNLVSLLVEFLFLSRVYQRVPQLPVKPQQQAGDLPRKATGGCGRSSKKKGALILGEMDPWEATDGFLKKNLAKKERKKRGGWVDYLYWDIWLALPALAFLYCNSGVFLFVCFADPWKGSRGTGHSGRLRGRQLRTWSQATPADAGEVPKLSVGWFLLREGIVVMVPTGQVQHFHEHCCVRVEITNDLGVGGELKAPVPRVHHALVRVVSTPGPVAVTPVLSPGPAACGLPWYPPGIPEHRTHSRHLLVSATYSHLVCPLCCCPEGLWSFDLIVPLLLQENIPEMERGAENGVQCSLNSLTGLIHVILIMLAPRPQQLGKLVFISTMCVTTGHSM
uniref:Solute carrier family 40 member n=1 Tax=Myotis lucifugus TaxID=59463 RepID=G1PXY7_MYOLU